MKNAKRFLKYALRYRLLLVIAFGLIMFTSLAVNYLPVLIQQITDSCLIDTSRPITERMNELVRLALIYLSIAAAGQCVRYLQTLLTAWIGQRVIYDLRTAVFRKVQQLHLAYFDRTPVGTLMTRVTSDIERLQHFVTEGVVGSIADLFMLVGIMGYMIWFSPTLSFSIFATLPFLFALMYFINVRLRNANRDIRDRQSKLNALLQEDLNGMTTIQLFNREKRALQTFDERNAHLRTAHYDEVRWFSLYFPTIEGGQMLAILLTLAIGGLLILKGSEAITIGKLVAFLAYIRNFFHPLGSLSDKAGSFQVAIASIERIFDLLDTDEQIKDPEKPLPAEQLSGTIAFHNVTFGYNPENPVLKDISFSVEPGQVLAVVGATGAGKSTIINLIGRFYDIQQGSITINGNDIRDFSQHDLRSRLGYVFQDPFIFSGTVAENIQLDHPDISREQLMDAAKIVNAHAFIQAMPNGYDTVLHERGAGLSLGQKQLLVMARTLAQNPQLLFVLDEATASIDTATEMLIQDALSKLMNDRTSIVIAHRLSTIRHADRILVMRHGQLIDQGTHTELLERDGYYHHLYEMLLHTPASLKCDD